jgi:hypothetical protein
VESQASASASQATAAGSDVTDGRWMADEWRLGDALEAFDHRLGLVTSKLRTIRPDITDAVYDLKLDSGQLKVVDDTLDERSRIWLEESLNGDQELRRLAADFNTLAVDVLDPKDMPETSAWNVGRHYDKLDSTIDRSTRFVSLLKSVRNTSAVSWYADMPYRRAASLVERQVIADTYAYQAKGGAIELMRNMSAPPFHDYF